MGRRKLTVPSKIQPINMLRSDLRYLKARGINVSKFMRQAVAAHKDEKWIYNYFDDEEDIMEDGKQESSVSEKLEGQTTSS